MSRLAELTATAEVLTRANAERFGTDPAIGSGIRRKPNAKADARRFGAYDREAAAWKAVEDERQRVEREERAAERARRDAPVPFTEGQLRTAAFVRDKHGWHRVVKVNAKSVTVETPWSWTDRIDRSKVLEVRAVAS